MCDPMIYASTVVDNDDIMPTFYNTFDNVNGTDIRHVAISSIVLYQIQSLHCVELLYCLAIGNGVDMWDSKLSPPKANEVTGLCLI